MYLEGKILNGKPHFAGGRDERLGWRREGGAYILRRASRMDERS